VSEEPTTPDLAELARRAIEAASAGDFELLTSFCQPDAVWESSRGSGAVFEGRDAIHRWLEDWWAAYDEWEVIPEEISYLGNGVVFDVCRQRARPVGSVGFVEFRNARVALWVNGLIERMAVYTDIDEARAAAERLAEERG
jgi:ketosteroid isomerase-like protein